MSVLGQRTRFAQNATRASFGAGITVVSLTVNSPTRATAVINIDPAAAPGPRDVVLTTGSEAAALANGFTVNPGTPTLTQVSPNTGQQGQQNLTVKITGQFTHFAQGITQVSFGAGIAVASLTVDNLDAATAVINIDPAAAPGPRDVVLTTGSEAAALAGGFTVNPGTPTLTQVSPNTGQQGQQNLTVKITGQFTHFVQGVVQRGTRASFGAGITVASLTVHTPTTATAVLNIGAAAATGPRDVTLTTNTEDAALPNGFTVTSATPQPTLTQVNPNMGEQGQQNLSITITGQNTNFAQGATQASFGDGITVLSLTVNSPTAARAVINIDPAAAPGPRDVVLTTGSEAAALANGFTVNPGTPTLTQVSPNTGRQGQQNLSVNVTGQFTHFVQGTTLASFGAGITVASLTVNSPTTAVAVLNIDAAAAIGPRDVALTTSTEIAALLNGFTVTSATPQPTLTQVSPNMGQQGQQNLSVSITGQNTNFAQGATQASFGDGITVLSLTVNSPTAARAVINIDPAAAPGPRDVVLTTGSEAAALANGFTVNPGTPTLTQVSPNTGRQGQQNLSVNVTGQFTHFVQGTTLASFGAGITVASLTVNSPTTAVAVLNIDAAAAIGPRDVALTTSTEIAALLNGFTVTSATPQPTLTQVSPNMGQQGQQGLSVSITGQNTHFAQGLTQVSLGSGISVSAVAVSGPTALTAQVTIAAGASVGTRTVIVVTGAEQPALANGFNVQPAGAALLSVTPNSAAQGQAISVTVTGQNTNFVQGMTQMQFGPGVMVGGGIAGAFGPVTVTGPTTATAQLSILNSALPSSRNVTAQTGSEAVSLANGFTVIGTPLLLPVIPSAGRQGQSVQVTITGLYTNFAQGVTQASFGAGVSVGGGPAGGFGPVTVTGPTTATAQLGIATNAAPGLRSVTVQTGAEQASAPESFSVFGPITGPGPAVSITSPAEAAEVSAPTTVTGTVTSPNLNKWTLEYQPAGTATWTAFAMGSASAVSGTFDPTALLNGNIAIRLTGVDTSGQTGSTMITVIVTKNQKIGNFTVAFNDLSVPVAGLPIQVVRTYDSRDKAIGDFGVGWRLDLKTVRLSTNVVLGDSWMMTRSGGFFPTYCVVEAKPHVVTATLTDGTNYTFKPKVIPECQQLVPQDFVDITFSPTGNTPPNASLSLASGGLIRVSSSAPGPLTLIDLEQVTTLDPDQYVLTLPDGRALQVSRQVGLQGMTDLNGNRLTVTAAGISHSSGKSVSFQRDGQGRITRITDPVGNALVYTYDIRGDLASFMDQENNTTTYTYDNNHGLLTIKDPRNIQPIRNDYDASGRLVSHTDAFGNTINYAHNTGTRQEIVTDRLNNITVNEYDADGNIVRVTDALGGVTERKYDSRGNMLEEKNALGKTRIYTYDDKNNRRTETDPLRNTTTYTYNDRNQVLTIKDPLDRLTTNTYDEKGNLKSTKDPAGNETTYTYNASGLQTSIKDPLNGVTGFVYDAAGNLTKQTDPLNNVTTYTYDANGNRRTETRTRTTASGQETLVTSYEYDKLNRLVKTTYPDGSTTQIEYNAIGKQSKTIDQLLRETTYRYDEMGRLAETTFPDGTSESATYDAEGNRLTSTDRAGRTTTYFYDKLKRLEKTAFPDGAVTETTYDAVGQIETVKDPRGNVTRHGYDNAGRRAKVTDAMGHITGFDYDAAGNLMSVTDANGNKTEYKYDENNRRTKTIYPDGSSDSVDYDALGRASKKTDQAGLSTQFKYDGLGRLIEVMDVLGQVTKYAYDEVGNRITQTDANTNTTRFAYDQLGRRTRRMLPLGMSETYVYDAAGNLKNKTDFNSKTTTYDYDAVNRLTGKTPDPSLGEPAVSFAYTMTGQRRMMVDASGTTTYDYDLRDRLTQKATPQGTLSYTYDEAGNLKSIRSSNTNGTSVDYTYDELNRLKTVRDNRLASGITAYNYDKVGNLEGYMYPNGVQTAYKYNALNRLTDVVIGQGTSVLASYAYRLGPAGNRTQVNELGGRQVNYMYDELYRLKSETITGSADPGSNGTIGYQYDTVGNRLQRTSMLTAVPTSSYSYDANDRLTSDLYDANGSTTGSGGDIFAYDYENHLKSKNNGDVTIVYDGDGNRVAKTAAGVTTKYLIDDRNLTGYAQVLEEIVGDIVQRVYIFGSNRISQSQASGISFYGYDGHSNVRILTDIIGSITDRYDYDSFGNMVSAGGTTTNSYHFAGEQFDSTLGLMYLRARYLNLLTGRFQTQDPIDGIIYDPLTLHKYLYASCDPVNKVDPSGRLTLLDTIAVAAIINVVASFTIGTIWAKRTFDYLPPDAFTRPPDAALFGYQVSTSVSSLLLSRGLFVAAAATLLETGVGGVDLLVPLSNPSKLWVYGYFGASINAAPSFGTSLSGYAGFVWNVRAPVDYTGPFYSLSGNFISARLLGRFAPGVTIFSSKTGQYGFSFAIPRSRSVVSAALTQYPNFNEVVIPFLPNISLPNLNYTIQPANENVWRYLIGN